MSAPTAASRLAAISPIWQAVILMVVASAALACMHGTVRYVSSGLHPFEIAFFRNLFGFMLFVPWLVRSGLGVLRSSRPGAHFSRALLNTCSMLGWFMALSLVPLAEATALSLTGPLFVTLGAMAFLAERVRFGRWVALAVGASGALVIIRPGFQTLHIGMLLAILTAALASGSKLYAKSLTRTDRTATIVAWVQLIMAPLTLLAALPFWHWPSLDQLGWLALIGALGGCGHFLFTKAYSKVDASFAEPIVFTRLIWASLFGVIVFGEFPDAWTWLGAAMIVTATSYLARRERAP